LGAFGEACYCAPMKLFFVLAILLAPIAACAPPRGSVTDIAGVMPRLEFTMTRANDGKPVRAADYRGKIVILYFGYTHCPDECPTTLANLASVLARLGAKASRVRVLFVSVDPERDTEAVMKDYLSNFDPHVRGLTGDQASIDAAIKEYRVYAKKIPLKDGDYTMDHTAVVYLMDKSGNFVAPFDVTNQKPEAVAAELRRYM